MPNLIPLHDVLRFVLEVAQTDDGYRKSRIGKTARSMPSV